MKLAARHAVRATVNFMIDGHPERVRVGARGGSAGGQLVRSAM